VAKLATGAPRRYHRDYFACTALPMTARPQFLLAHAAPLSRCRVEPSSCWCNLSKWGRAVRR